MKKLAYLSLISLAFLVINSQVFATGSKAHQHHNTDTHSSQGSEHGNMQGEGVIRRINQEQNKLTIKHGPIGKEMPPMTMEFRVMKADMLRGMNKGDQIIFMINRDMVITSIKLK
jgi:Cu(I)/Ag(I) efflux system protein CusF